MRSVSFWATQVAHLRKEDAGVQQEIVRLHNTRIDPAGASRSRFGRREMVRLVNEQRPDCWTIVQAMGGNVAKDEIAIDYDSRIALGLTYKQDAAEILVEPAPLWAILAHYAGHPHPITKVTIWLAIASVFLALVGLLIGVLPAVWTFASTVDVEALADRLWEVIGMLVAILGAAPDLIDRAVKAWIRAKVRFRRWFSRW